jgi:hypothetical protein
MCSTTNPARLRRKADVIANLSSGKIRYLCRWSQPAAAFGLLRDDVAIVHGSEDDEVEQDGKQFPVATFIWMS